MIEDGNAQKLLELVRDARDLLADATSNSMIPDRPQGVG
jgi:hypothetical protein